jgi:hypothetical protein
MLLPETNFYLVRYRSLSLFQEVTVGRGLLLELPETSFVTWRGVGLVPPGGRISAKDRRYFVTLEDAEAPEEAETLARDPATPWDVLLLLGQVFPAAFLENPLLALLALENPGFWSELPYPLLDRLLRESEPLPPSFLASLERHADAEVFEDILVERVSAPGASPALRAAARDCGWESVRRAVAVKSSAEGGT